MRAWAPLLCTFVSFAAAHEPEEIGIGAVMLWVAAFFIWGGVACVGLTVFFCTAVSCEHYARVRNWLRGSTFDREIPFAYT